jgi:hypothetical protein
VASRQGYAALPKYQEGGEKEQDFDEQKGSPKAAPIRPACDAFCMLMVALQVQMPLPVLPACRRSRSRVHA